MTPENFCYWLQGVFEVSNPQEMSKEQLDVVKEHLQLVFNKITVLQAKSVVGTATDITSGNKLCDYNWGTAWLERHHELNPHLDLKWLEQDGPPRSC